MDTTQSIEWWVRNITDRSSRGIALETAALIRSGALRVGTQLPSVRDLAQALNVSPATVSSAWGELRRFKAINGQGRKGMWVSGDNVSPHPPRFEIVNAIGDKIVANLSPAQPDPALLPNLSEALEEGLRVQALNEYDRSTIIIPLQDAAQRTWPYRADAMLATNGGYDAISLTLHTLLRPGAIAAVEEPTAARILDILEYLGVQVAPVACDCEGPDPESLRHVLKRKPSVFIYQPRTHGATGTVHSDSRHEMLVRLLAEHDTLIIEDDGLGELSGRSPISLGDCFPDRTVHIRSYSKSLGPDLRVAVLSSSKDIVARIQAFRNFSARWTSRILQGAVAWMLEDNDVKALVDRARKVYGQRRNALISAVADRGVATQSRDGLCVWIPVESEQFALLTMTACGIAVAPGNWFRLSTRQCHMRVSIGRLTENVDSIADAIARASRIS